MDTKFVVMAEESDDAYQVAVYDTEEEALEGVRDCYAEDYAEEFPQAGDRMMMPFEQFVREHPTRFKHYETVYYSKED